MAKSYILTKSKYIRGLQCEKAMYLDVYKPKLAYYPPETLAKFRQGRVFEKSFKDTFPGGVDISARLRYKMDSYPILTAELLRGAGEVTLFEAGFLYNEVLVLADVVHKHADGRIDIYEVKNSAAVSDTFRNDVAIQYYVVRHALEAIQPGDLQGGEPLSGELLGGELLGGDIRPGELRGGELLGGDIRPGELRGGELRGRELRGGELRGGELFCDGNGFKLEHFYLLYNDGSDGFVKEDLLAQVRPTCGATDQKVNHFKQVLSEEEPDMDMSDQCDSPYECPYKRYCKRLKK